MNGLTLPMSVSPRELRAVLKAAFVQTSVFDFARRDPWFTIGARDVDSDYFGSSEQTGLTLRLVR